MILKFQNNPYDTGKCKLVGAGHNGQVYLLPNGKVIKLSSRINSFIDEYSILERVNGNKYFPQIYEIGFGYMIRDYIEGDNLISILYKNGLCRDLAIKIIDMLKEFETLKFSKIDIRCKDIYVQPNGNLKIIDPKKFYSKSRTFPKHLIKGLYKLKVLDSFLLYLKEYDNFLYSKWNKEIVEYIKFGSK